MPAKPTEEIDHSTEERIRQAARELFIRKGYAAVTTREIALKAGINLALLNYYYRSKERLFNLIIGEALEQFMKGIARIFYDKETSLEQKIKSLAESYIDMLSQHPELPLFILSELRSNPDHLVERVRVNVQPENSVLIKQVVGRRKGRSAQTRLFHFISNMMGLILFPFIAQPMLQQITHVDDRMFLKLMKERKKLVPEWVELLMKG